MPTPPPTDQASGVYAAPLITAPLEGDHQGLVHDGMPEDMPTGEGPPTLPDGTPAVEGDVDRADAVHGSTDVDAPGRSGGIDAAGLVHDGTPEDMPIGEGPPTLPDGMPAVEGDVDSTDAVHGSTDVDAPGRSGGIDAASAPLHADEGGTLHLIDFMIMPVEGNADSTDAVRVSTDVAVQERTGDTDATRMPLHADGGGMLNFANGTPTLVEGGMGTDDDVSIQQGYHKLGILQQALKAISNDAGFNAVFAAVRATYNDIRRMLNEKVDSLEAATFFLSGSPQQLLLREIDDVRDNIAAIDDAAEDYAEINAVEVYAKIHLRHEINAVAVNNATEQAAVTSTKPMPPRVGFGTTFSRRSAVATTTPHGDQAVSTSIPLDMSTAGRPTTRRSTDFHHFPLHDDMSNVSSMGSMGSCNDVFTSARENMTSSAVIADTTAIKTDLEADIKPAKTDIEADVKRATATPSADDDRRAAAKRTADDHAQLVKRLSKKLDSNPINFTTTFDPKVKSFNVFCKEQYNGFKQAGIAYLLNKDSKDADGDIISTASFLPLAADKPPRTNRPL